MAQLHNRLETQEPEDEPEARMGFLDHLDELRARLIKSCIALGAGMVVALFFVDRIASFVLAATIQVLPPGSELIATRWGETFSFYLNVALITGAVVAAPFVSFQVWRFIAPGLYSGEKTHVVPFVVLAVAATICGALFSHYVLFPGTMAFFAGFSSPRVKFLPRIEDTLDQYLKMLLAMVIVFQLPPVVFILAKMRLVTARLLWRNIEYTVLVIFILAAVLTAWADPWNQTVFAAPMIALYLFSIGLASVVEPKRDRVSETRPGSGHLRLVFAATVLDQATRRARHSPARRSRLWDRDRVGPA